MVLILSGIGQSRKLRIMPAYEAWSVELKARALLATALMPKQAVDLNSLQVQLTWTTQGHP
jgi:plasmid stability protein